MSQSSESHEVDTARRGFLAALIAGGAYVAGWFTGPVAAQTPSGSVGSASEPVEVVYTERVNIYPRTSDPSSPDDGTLWYNEDA